MSNKPTHSTTHKDTHLLTGTDDHHTIISQDNGWWQPPTIRGEGHGSTSEQSQKNARDDYRKNQINE